MKIAHISDLHISSDAKYSLLRFINKRAIGAVNLFFNRKKEYPPKMVEKLVEHLMQQNVEHTVITGDLTNLAFPEEFQRAKEILSPLENSVTIIPGNHDNYTRESFKKSRFSSYFPETVPNVKKIGDEVAVIALSTSVPTGYFFSAGKISKAQLKFLEETLTKDDIKDRFKIVLIHHHIEKVAKHKQYISSIRNRAKLLSVLEKYKIDVVLHGHRHENNHYQLHLNSHTVDVYECGASGRVSKKHPGNYNIYTIENKKITNISKFFINPDSLEFEER
ncbi:metallophosphoesterase [bacterium]|nr:metallophosphoesterase [bacterium]